MRARWLLRAGLAASIGGAALVGSRLAQYRDDASGAYRFELRRLEALDAELSRELLRSRSGLTMHYDDLTQTFEELRRTTTSVATLPSDPGLDPSPSLRTSIGRIGELVQGEATLIERFKAHNAILRNSRQYFPALLDTVREQLDGARTAGPLRDRLTAVLSALAHIDVAPAADVVDSLSGALAALESTSRGLPPGRLADDLALVLTHGRLIVRHSAIVDGFVSDILKVPLGDEIARASASFEASARLASASRQRSISLLTLLIASAVVLSLLEVIARARADARALRQARDELTRANAALDRERQRERQQNELKTRFVSATSHEFRTPLTTILSSSQMLATYGERWDAERRRTHFDRISTAADHMTQMLEEILLIGRAEMGVLSAAPTELDLEEFCRSLIETLSRSHAERTIELSVAGNPLVHLDRRLLTHVLGNLLENALKYSEAGSSVEIAVTVEPDAVRCVVRDAGVGIPAEDLPQLFDSFYRGKNVGAVSGTGLGLAVVKRAVDVQHGRIDVQSECGRGTTVTVWLPLGAADAPGAAPARASDTPASPGNQPTPSLPLA